MPGYAQMLGKTGSKTPVIRIETIAGKYFDAPNHTRNIQPLQIPIDVEGVFLRASAVLRNVEHENPSTDSGGCSWPDDGRN
jgi:hypothetical protein